MANKRTSASKQKKAEEEKSQLSLQWKIKKTFHPPPKRKKCPGIRIVGNQTYDSENGQSFHQCRQKTGDFAAACKNRNWRNKSCKGKYCHKCLRNRKEKGCLPTGIPAPTAKKTGFSSVSEMLHLKGPETIEKVIEGHLASPNEQNASSNKAIENIAKDSLASPNEQVASVKAIIAYSRRKCNKENISSEQRGSNDKVKPTVANKDEMLESEKGGKKKLKMDEDKGKVNKNIHDGHGIKKINLETNKSTELFLNAGKKAEKMEKSDLQTAEETKMPNRENAETAEVKKVFPASTARNWKKCALSTSENVTTDFTLPQGNELTAVDGIELATDDVGPALQFLEFCKAFGEVLDLKTGQPESILRELMHGRAMRRGWYSSVVQFQIKLLSIIQKDLAEEGSLLDSTSGSRSWLQVLHKFISTSQCALKELPLECINWKTNEYEKLSSSRKLQVLNFLCDETLCTEDLRGWMDEENSKYMERKKEAREEFPAAKEKVNCVKEERSEVTQAFFPKIDGGAFSASDHRDLLSKINSETRKAKNKKLEEMTLLAEKTRRSDAIRTEPVLLDVKGQVYWRLRGYLNQSCLLLQVVEDWDMHTPKEKWFICNDEQEKVVKKYVSSSKRKRNWPHKTSDMIALEMDDATVKHDIGISSSQNVW